MRLHSPSYRYVAEVRTAGSFHATASCCVVYAATADGGATSEFGITVAFVCPLRKPHSTYATRCLARQGGKPAYLRTLLGFFFANAFAFLLRST